MKRYLYAIVGCMFMAIAINGFIKPMGFVTGGFSGLAIALSRVLNVSTGTLLMCLNVPLFICALKLEGKVFVLDCFITTLLCSTMIDLFAFIPVFTNDYVIAAIFGGIIDGVGVGLCYRSRMSSGGTELLVRLVLHYVHTVSPGKMLQVLSTVVIIIATAILGKFELIFYSFVVVFMEGNVSDRIIIGGDNAKMCQIVTIKPDIMIKEMMNSSQRGITVIKAKGAYSDCDRSVLMTVVRLSQVRTVKDIVKRIDNQAFVIISDVSQVLGKGFTNL